MIERLEIYNFLTIKKAVLEISEINIIIGRQAQGKSIIAKLDYYFSKISEEFLDGIRSGLPKRDLDKRLLEKFEGYFPRYAWEGSEFLVKYQFDGVEVSLEGEKKANNKTKLKLNYSKNLVNLYASRKKVYKNAIESISLSDEESYKISFNEGAIFNDVIYSAVKKGELSGFFGEAIFIPASRSFFANLQKNIFTFLASNLDIDPFIKEFGHIYDSTKRIYHMRTRRGIRNSTYKSSRNQVEDTIQHIVGGKYEYRKEQDWIVSKNKSVNVANASSGQQEALPMLLLLSVWPFSMGARGAGNGKLFIEEPEAHLFPEAQSDIVSVFSHLYKRPGARFFITTHSPYILTAVNNLVMAQDVIEKGKLTKREFQEKNGGGEPIRFEDVSAYTINNGVLTSIKDDESRMIGGDMLDEVSERFEDVVDFLMSADDE